jgi:phage-related protein
MLYVLHCRRWGIALDMAQQRWIIEFYETRNGRRPAEDFLESLTDEEFVHVDRKLQRLEKYGRSLKPPDVKYLRDKIWELRARCRRSRIRILYFFYDGHKFVLSHGFRKKSGPVPDSEIDKAVAHRKDYLAQQMEKSR